ncbi:MAG: hypothetical protein AAB865_02615, partial [Patescibacteria group bacterium]
MFAALLIITFVVFAAIAWRDLRWGIFLILAVLPSYLVRFSIGPIPFTLLEGLVLIAFGVWLVKIYDREKFRAAV